MQIWDIVPPLDATAYARDLLPNEGPNSLNTLLPDRSIVGIESVTARTATTRTTATFRSYNAETPIGRRPVTVTTTTTKLPPIGQKLLITEWERLWFAFSQRQGGAQAALVQTIYDDLAHNVNAIRNRLELARGQVLATGAFTLTAENGLTLSADFGIDPTHTPTAGTSWANAAAPILSDEIAWHDLLRDAGKVPARVTVSRATLRNMLKADEYTLAYHGFAGGPTLNPAQLDSVRAANQLAPLSTYDNQLDVDGVTTRVLPVDLYLLTADGVGETQFGTTAESLELVGSNAVDFTVEDTPGVFAAAYKQPDPVTGWTKATAVAMPVLGDVDGIVSADTIP